MKRRAVKILKNTLEGPSLNFHYILFESGNFTIKIIYIGDYLADKANNAIKEELIVPHIKSRGPLINLALSGGDAWLDISLYSKLIRTKEDVEELSRQLMTSVEAVDDAKSVYESFFGQYSAKKAL